MIKYSSKRNLFKGLQKNGHSIHQLPKVWVATRLGVISVNVGFEKTLSKREKKPTITKNYLK